MIHPGTVHRVIAAALALAISHAAATADVSTHVYKGVPPDVWVCDQALRLLPKADGFVHFAFDYNRHDLIYFGAGLDEWSDRTQ